MSNATRHLDRITAAALGKPRTLPSGAVVYDAVLARPGVLTYRRNGVIFRERVPESTLRDPELLLELERAPVTIEHVAKPTKKGKHFVDLENAKGLVHGDVANVRYVEGVGLCGEVALRTPEALTYVKRGGWGISLAYDVDPNHLDTMSGIDPEHGEYHATQLKRRPNSLCITTNARSQGAQLRLDSANTDVYVQEDQMPIPPKKPAEGESKGPPSEAGAEGQAPPSEEALAQEEGAAHEAAPGDPAEDAAEGEPHAEGMPGEGAAPGAEGGQPVPSADGGVPVQSAPTGLSEEQLNQIADLVAARVLAPLMSAMSSNFGDGSMFAASLGRISSLGDRFDTMLSAPRLDSADTDFDAMYNRRRRAEQLADGMNMPADQRGSDWRELERALVRATAGEDIAERMDSAGADAIADVAISMALRQLESSRKKATPEGDGNTDDGQIRYKIHV